MTDIYLNNSLTRKKEKFVPINPARIGMYTCGPTVYDYATIGNFRTYVTADMLLRVLKFNGYDVDYIMNLTDVGHLTGDGDLGTDKVEAKAKLEKKTAWDIAKFYTESFFKDFEELNLLPARKFPKATEHIKEQIEMVKKLEDKGYTYETSDGVYFDTKEYETKTGRKYGELSTLDERKRAKRKLVLADKKDPRDFALWKFSPKTVKRHMEWKSPWGLGFPGWHIECSAMSMKYLGESFDIHIGGEDLRQTHHPNEIAQSEAVTRKLFVKYWVHTTFLKVDGKKMSKSLKNIITIDDIKKKGLDPLALRYLYLTAHYRDSLNFTWRALEAAQAGLDKLRDHASNLKNPIRRTVLSEEKRKKIASFTEKFRRAMNDDLNSPTALSTLWMVLKSNIPARDKYDLAISFDEVLGLGLDQIKAKKSEKIETKSGRPIITPTRISGPTIGRIEERDALRDKGKYEEADKKRIEIKEKDKISIKDTAQGTVVEPED